MTRRQTDRLTDLNRMLTDRTDRQTLYAQNLKPIKTYIKPIKTYIKHIKTYIKHVKTNMKHVKTYIRSPNKFPEAPTDYPIIVYKPPGQGRPKIPAQIRNTITDIGKT